MAGHFCRKVMTSRCKFPTLFLMDFTLLQGKLKDIFALGTLGITTCRDLLPSFPFVDFNGPLEAEGPIWKPIKMKEAVEHCAYPLKILDETRVGVLGQLNIQMVMMEKEPYFPKDFVSTTSCWKRSKPAGVPYGKNAAKVIWIPRKPTWVRELENKETEATVVSMKREIEEKTENATLVLPDGPPPPPPTTAPAAAPIPVVVSVPNNSPKSVPKVSPKIAPKEAAKESPKIAPKPHAKASSISSPKAPAKDSPKSSPKAHAKASPKIAPKASSKSSPKAHAKPSPKGSPKEHAKPSSKATSKKVKSSAIPINTPKTTPILQLDDGIGANDLQIPISIHLRPIPPKPGDKNKGKNDSEEDEEEEEDEMMPDIGRKKGKDKSPPPPPPPPPGGVGGASAGGSGNSESDVKETDASKEEPKESNEKNEESSKTSPSHKHQALSTSIFKPKEKKKRRSSGQLKTRPVTKENPPRGTPELKPPFVPMKLMRTFSQTFDADNPKISPAVVPFDANPIMEDLNLDLDRNPSLENTQTGREKTRAKKGLKRQLKESRAEDHEISTKKKNLRLKSGIKNEKETEEENENDGLIEKESPGKPPNKKQKLDE